VIESVKDYEGGERQGVHPLLCKEYARSLGRRRKCLLMGAKFRKYIYENVSYGDPCRGRDPTPSFPELVRRFTAPQPASAQIRSRKYASCEESSHIVTIFFG